MRFSYLLIPVLILTASCKKGFYGSVYNIQPTDVTRTSIVCGGYIEVVQGEPNILSCGIAYSLDAGYAYKGTHVPADSLVQKGVFKCSVTDLIPDTTYYLISYLETVDGFRYSFSDEMEVRTEYSVGNTGPAGGLIFYMNALGQGIEVSPENLGVAAHWGCVGISVSGASVHQLYGGEQNTLDILAECTDINSAASLCENYTLNGYDDWFLPSTTELNLIYTNLVKQGKSNIQKGYHWSSCQVSENRAWSFSMYSGDLVDLNKTNNCRVRAVRYFN